MLIPRSALSVAEMADDTSSRYALSAIQLERGADGSPVAVGADGRAMVAVTWPEPADYPVDIAAAAGVDLTPRPGGPPVLLPGAAVATLTKCKIGAKSRKPALTHFALAEPADDKKNTVQIVAADGDETASFSPRLAEGQFPRWRKFLPPPAADEIRFSVDGKLLAKLLVCLNTNAPSAFNQVTFSLPADYRKSDCAAPVVVTAASDDGRRAVGLIATLGSAANKFDAAEWRGQVEPVAAAPAAPVAEPAAEAEPKPRRRKPAEPEPVAAAGEY